MTKIFQWCKTEIAHLIPAIIYFAICFNLFHFAQTLLMQPQDIQYTGYVGATLGAILAGKVILIAENIPFFNAFPNKPILYNITWKFFIYSIFVLLVQIIDHVLKQLYHTGNCYTACIRLLADLSQKEFWGIQMFVLMFFLVFIVFTELARVIGQSKMKEIFFGWK